MRTLLWYRGKDLRVRDHAPLIEAARMGEVIPTFVIDPYFFAPERARAMPHRIQYLLDSIAELQVTLEKLGSKLILVKGRSTDIIPKLAERWRVDRVAAHRWVEPFGRERDRRIEAQLAVPLVLYEGETLLAPGLLRTGAGNPYSVFTPFKRAFMARLGRGPGKMAAAPRSLPPLPNDIRTKSSALPTLKSFGITRNAILLAGGETHAHKRLRAFIKSSGDHYDESRDRMDLDRTSRLSADIKFGTLSIRTVWTHVAEKISSANARSAYLNELIWREFSHSTLWDRPELLEQPFRSSFAGFPWRANEGAWQAWVSGKTGYPVVDAASRQLLAEGFVHNRARMISASFLTKHLLISYRRGEAHYLEYLVDGDWAQNNAGWQWSAGCGCDAQPYFRVFNPVTQGQRYDPTGAYVRKWVPELRPLPNKWLHAPWTAPREALADAGIELGNTYPQPIVTHPAARREFLAVAKTYLRSHQR